METRTIDYEVRNTEHCFSGYCALFHNPADSGTEFKLADNLWERISPTAFERTVRESKDIMALYNHDPARILARTSARNLVLHTDTIGLRFSITYDGDDADHRQLRAKINSKCVRGCSFGFRVKADRFFKERGRDIRELMDVDLVEVTITPIPAYQATQAQFRSEHYSNWKETYARIELAEGL